MPWLNLWKHALQILVGDCGHTSTQISACEFILYGDGVIASIVARFLLPQMEHFLNLFAIFRLQVVKLS